MARPAHRRVSRIVLLDENDNFLLFRTSSPRLLVPVVRWITPGGGVDPHENHHEGAVRELYEETGLRVENLGESFHSVSGESIFNDGHVQSTYTEFFVHRTSHFMPTTENWLPNEHVDITDTRWWTLGEISQLDQGEYSPSGLQGIVKKAIKLTS